MPYFLIANALILISVLSGILVNSNIHWISRHHVKVISLNMGLLLAFTVIELIPSAIDISHKGLIFVVIGILLPNFFIIIAIIIIVIWNQLNLLNSFLLVRLFIVFSMD